ncbi:MAG TPA: hypothetical protein VF730_17575, partial [Terracidiphilus sp.]
MALGTYCGSQAKLGSRLLFLAVAIGSVSGAAYAAAPLPAAVNPPGAAPAGSQASSQMYWVCTWFNTNSTVYISDVFAAGTFTNSVGPTELVPPFQKFVAARYPVNLHAGSANCIYKFSQADAQTYLQQRISKPPSGMHVVQTGWKYGMTASGGEAPATQGAYAPVAAAPAASEAVPVQSEPSSPVTTSITLRLVDAVNSSTDPAGKHYRAVVTQAANAGSVQIPVNTLGAVTLVQQSPGHFSAQLVSLRLSGQDVPVTSTAVSASSMTQQVAKKLGGFLSSIGKQATGGQASTAVNTVGNHVAIPPGTSLTFTTTVHQPAAPAASAAPPAQQAMAASAPIQNAGQPSGEAGPDGQVIGGSTSGVMTAYSCDVEVIPPGKHRQTTYVTAPFTSTQPQRWITFWFSQHIHQTYNIPAYVQNFNVDCRTFGNKTPAQQQAAVNADINRWRERNDDVVQLHWVPTQTPTPGVSVSQLNNMTGQMMTGAIGSNMPPNTNPAGSVALCNVPAID